VVAEVGSDDDTRLYLLDSDGQVAKTCPPGMFSGEDDLYRHVFAVKGTQLVRQWSIENRGGTETGVDVELEGLCALGEEASPTPAEVDAALGARRRRREASEKSIRARIDELARAPANALPELARSRERLAERVVRQSDRVAGLVLGLVNALAHLRGGTAGAAARELEAATRLVGKACAFVTFDPQGRDRRGPVLEVDFSGIPRTPVGPVLDVLVEPRRRLEEHLMQGEAAVAREALAVVDSLEAVASKLVFAADAQSYVDARGNAACYLRAAGLADAAAARLAKACQHILTS